LVHRHLALALIVGTALLQSIRIPTTEAFITFSRSSPGSTRLHIQPTDTAKEEGLTLDPIPTGDVGNELECHVFLWGSATAIAEGGGRNHA
jgi:hypothetical protein